MNHIATKQEERNILNKIHKIVDSLDENSYVKTAFEGVFEIAELNINNDYAFSCKYYIDFQNSYSDKLRDMQDHIDKLNAEIKIAEMDYENHERTIAALNHEKECLVEKNCAIISEMQKTIDELTNKLERKNDPSGEILYQTEEYTMKDLLRDNDYLRQEIVQLKAKLYDYMQ